MSFSVLAAPLTCEEAQADLRAQSIKLANYSGAVYATQELESWGVSRQKLKVVQFHMDQMRALYVVRVKRSRKVVNSLCQQSLETDGRLIYEEHKYNDHVF